MLMKPGCGVGPGKVTIGSRQDRLAAVAAALEPGRLVADALGAGEDFGLLLGRSEVGEAPQAAASPTITIGAAKRSASLLMSNHRRNRRGGHVFRKGPSGVGHDPDMQHLGGRPGR